ncbi:alginate lyase family protein [Glaciecola sp. KUL10]|uniref:alginate lyase family protein n=1 Tax=Glaciecola sp. (strain KUL10) TaxID=2161813 RepID=UPI000D78BB10|nr:alginate lyase family protein [Glaciecola sp. KUL10]GBL05957.1 hypothetical protein KUL10_32900 [Glaciecola sp. KUL10]
MYSILTRTFFILLLSLSVTLTVSADEQRLDKLLLLDADALANAKFNLYTKNSSNLFAVQLFSKAEAYAGSPPLSVTQNQSLPESGNLRDYFTIGPYWWPDASKRDGLPWINKDGQVNHRVRGPNSDSKLFDNLAERLKVLSLAYYFSGNSKYSKSVERHLQAWFLDNDLGMTPHMSFAQAVPGKSNGRGIGIIEIRKILGVLDAITLTSPALNQKTKDNLDTWFSVFLGWLIESKNGQDEAKKRNNHGTFYDATLIGLASYLDMPELAIQLMTNSRKRVFTQIDEQGKQAHELARTKPFHYSVFNLYAFSTIVNMAQRLETSLFSEGSREAIRLISAHNYLYNNLNTSTIWPGEQEKRLPVERLIATSTLLQQVYTDIKIPPFNDELLANHKEAQKERIRCSLLSKGRITDDSQQIQSQYLVMLDQRKLSDSLALRERLSIYKPCKILQ